MVDARGRGLPIAGDLDTPGIGPRISGESGKGRGCRSPWMGDGLRGTVKDRVDRDPRTVFVDGDGMGGGIVRVPFFFTTRDVRPGSIENAVSGSKGKSMPFRTGTLFGFRGMETRGGNEAWVVGFDPIPAKLQEGNLVSSYDGVDHGCDPEAEEERRGGRRKQEEG